MVAHLRRFNTANSMIDTLTEELMWASKDEADMVTSMDSHYHNILSECKSFDWEFNLKRYWLSERRWKVLSKQYVNPDYLDAWLKLIEDRMSSASRRGIGVMRTNIVEPTFTTGKARRIWGSCMLSVSFKMKPKPTITLHSRTSYVGYLAMFDITVAYNCAKLVGERLGIDPAEMEFQWFCEVMQYHFFRCQGFAFGDPDMLERVKELRPKDREDHWGAYGNYKWWKQVEKWDAEGHTYAEMKYGQNRRMRRILHAELYGPKYAQPFLSDQSGCRKPANPMASLSSNELNFDHFWENK